MPQDQDYALFIVGHGATLKVRKEMADWLKEKYPKVEILALNPPPSRMLPFQKLRRGFLPQSMNDR